MATKRLTTRALPEPIRPCGVGVFESHHADGFRMEWRSHPFIKVIYVQGGSGVLRGEDSQIPFSSRDLLTVPAHVPNRITDAPGAPSSLYILCLARKLLAFDRTIESRIAFGVTPAHAELAIRAESHFRRLRFCDRTEREAASLSMVIEALQLIRLVVGRRASAAQADHAQAVGPDLEMARYVEYLDQHFFEAVDIDHAAARLGMSRRAFTDRFRAATGSSWLGYVRSRAVEHACRLLADTTAPIASIAFECGFKDLSSFYRHFGARCGESPGAWRQRHRAGSHRGEPG